MNYKIGVICVKYLTVKSVIFRIYIYAFHENIASVLFFFQNLGN